MTKENKSLGNFIKDIWELLFYEPLYENILINHELDDSIEKEVVDESDDDSMPQP